MPGTITFRPVEANLTHDTDWLGKMDPYCVFTIGSQRVKSQVCKHGGTRPHWEDTVTMQADANQGVCLLEIMDKDRFRPDDNIAASEINLSEIQSAGKISKWYPVYHRKKLAGEILIEAAFQPAQQMMQQPVQPVFVQNAVPIQQTFVEERFMTSAPIVSGTEFTQVNQGMPVEVGQQFIGQSYEVPTNFTSGNFIQGTELSGFNNQIQPGFGAPIGQGLSGLPQGQFIQGAPLEQGFSGIPQGQFTQGGNSSYYNQGNLGGIQGGNIQPTQAGLIGNEAGLLASKTSALGPQGGIPHGHHTLKGATNAGYSERPGYTLGDVEANPTTQANLDTNGGGFFNRPGREKRAEPYSLSNPGTYGIPHGQTIDTAGHLHPEVGLNKQAPIGQINQPGYTGYPDNYNNNLGGAGQQNLNQGGLGGQGNTAL